MTKQLLIITFVLSSILTAVAANTTPIELVPMPQNIKVLDATFKLKNTISISRNALKNDTLILQQLKLECSYKGVQLVKAKGKSTDITLSIKLNKKVNQESYQLNISTDKIEITAPSSAGLFYGVQTLKQLIRSSNKQELPCVEISDQPDFAFRAVLDDISRGPVPQLAYMKEQIRRFSELKLNVLSYYTEHIIQTNVHPEYAPADGGIPLHIWDEITAYAAQHYMTVLPVMQSLGHSEEILAHPKYAHLGETNTMLALNNTETKQFLDESITDIAPHFSSPYFNVAGDETWDLGRGKSKALADSIGLAALYANHMKDVHDMVTKNGKQMMLYSDMATKHPEIFKLLPKDIIMQAWDYSDTDDFSHWVAPIKAHGFSYIAVTGILNSNKTLPNYGVVLNNIRKFSAYALKEGAIGTKVSVWDDGGRHSFNRDWYGVAYAADHAWHTNNSTIPEFDYRFNNAIYNDENLLRTQIIHKLNELNEIPETYEMNNRILWDKLIPERGQRVTINIANWPEILRIAEETKQLCAKANNNDDYYNYELPYLKFTADQYYYMAKSRLLLLEAAESYREACIIQYDDAPLCDSLLATSQRAINTSSELWTNLKDDMLSLWKKENQDYWLNYALDPYHKTETDYTELKTSFEWARKLQSHNKHLPTPLDIRLNITAVEGQYFRFWLLNYPEYRVKSPQHELEDMLESIGGEKSAVPFPGLSFEAKDGIKHHFSKYYSPLLDQVELRDQYQLPEMCFTYAYCSIESDKDQQVRATFGSNDGIEIFCNGERVFNVRKKRSVILDEDEVFLNLKKGKNHLLLKVEQWKGGWGFSFRLPDVEIRSHKAKYKIIAPE